HWPCVVDGPRFFSSAASRPCREARTRDPAASRPPRRPDPAGNRATSSATHPPPRRGRQLPPATSTTRATCTPCWQAELSSQRGQRNKIVTFVRCGGHGAPSVAKLVAAVCVSLRPFALR